jgi:pantothenate kinase
VITLRSVAEVADVIRSRMSADYRIVVGIAGSPGAGKSTIAAAVADVLAPDAIVLPMDGFHYPQARLVALGRRERMGAPDTFDVDGFRKTLVAIRRGFQNSGNPVDAPGFDRGIEEPVPSAIRVSPEFCIVIVEGNYLLLDSGGWERVAPMLDLTFFVELDPETRIERLVARHEKYGKPATEATEWALGPDEANAVVIEATGPRADYQVALR